MDDITGQFIARWKSIVAEKDIQGVFDILTPNVVFYSPVVFRPYQSREAATFLLANVMQVFGELRYTDSFANDSGGVVMHFQTSIDTPDKRMHIEGVDIFQLADTGLVKEMRVLVRPLSASQALALAMRKRVAGV